ncbi:MAG: selenocysteine-specific translation elongation factor [Myxococcota bacterium]
MRHVVIGTAGHVDHGKTSLVYALTGVKTDRLPEERRRGITIELGFAPWHVADDVTASIIDAPGHRRLVHHMIAGASGIDLVLLVVAGDEGVMPQTREHTAACRLLGVRKAVVAVTKVDRGDRELAELAAAETEDMLADHGIENAATILCSAHSGEGIDDLRARVRREVMDLPLPDRNRRVRLSVDRVFSVKGTGTVVTGTLIEGELKVGQPLRIVGPHRTLEATTRNLQVHGEDRASVRAPTRLAVNLGGVHRDEVTRGDVVTDDAFARPQRVLDVWLQSFEPLKRGRDASVFVGTTRSTAKIQPVEKTDALTEGGMARLRLTEPLVVVGGDRFVLRGSRVDGPRGAVIGGGRVLDASPPNRRAAKREAVLHAIDDEDVEATTLALIEEVAPRSLKKRDLRSRLLLGAEPLAAEAKRLAKEKRVQVVERNAWTTAENLEALTATAVALVDAHQRQAPLDPGLPKSTLRERLTALSDAEVAEAVLQHAVGQGRMIDAREHVHTPSFRGAQADAEAAHALAHARDALAGARWQGLTENAFKVRLDIPAKRVRAVLAALVREGAAVTAGGIWFDAEAVAELEAAIVAHLRVHEVLTIAAMKDLSGLGRKQVIPLLEHFDQKKLTLRAGSDRRRGPAFPPKTID